MCEEVCKAGLTHGSQEHSCAVLSSGAVKCWGGNGYGQVLCTCWLAMRLCVCVGMCFFTDKVFALQVGDGTGTNNDPSANLNSWNTRLTPVNVVGLGSGVLNVALGYVRLFCRGMFLGAFVLLLCVLL